MTKEKCLARSRIRSKGGRAAAVMNGDAIAMADHYQSHHHPHHHQHINGVIIENACARARGSSSRCSSIGSSSRSGSQSTGGSESATSRISAHTTSEKDVATTATVTASKPSGRTNGVRIFKEKESLVTQLVKKDGNFQAVYDAFTVQVGLLVFFVVLRDSFNSGRLEVDLSVVIAGFGSLMSLAACVLTEISLLALALSVHPLFKVWRKLRKVNACCFDMAFLFLYFLAMAVLMVAIAYLCVTVPLGSFCATVISVELVRFMLKTYSFIRENAYKVIYSWKSDDITGPAVWYQGQMDPKVGSFSQYLYFLFAPTLLYRDHYPRSKGPINWKKAFLYYYQFNTIIWLVSVSLKNFLFPASFHTKDLVYCGLHSLMLAFWMLAMAHACVLHSWLNFAAELTGFADREFYGDWWASTSFSSYYRKWNSVVYDWIYSYMYVDIKNSLSIISPVHRSRLAVFLTILISAVMHEYIIALGVGYCIPALLLMFGGAGVFFYLLRPFAIRRVSNIFVVSMLSIGTALLLAFYQIEVAARLYCPSDDDNKSTDTLYFFKPRLIECYTQFN